MDADTDDDQDSRCSASQYVQVRPPEQRILFQNRSYLSFTVRGYTTQSAFCNLGMVMMVVVVIVTMLDDFSPHDPFSEMFHLTIFSSPSSGRSHSEPRLRLCCLISKHSTKTHYLVIQTLLLSIKDGQDFLLLTSLLKYLWVEVNLGFRALQALHPSHFCSLPFNSTCFPST